MSLQSRHSVPGVKIPQLAAGERPGSGSQRAVRTLGLQAQPERASEVTVKFPSPGCPWTPRVHEAGLAGHQEQPSARVSSEVSVRSRAAMDAG